MKNRPILYLLFITIIFTSCASYVNSFSASKNIKKLELGMTKEEVINIMGNPYKPVSINEDNGDRNEVIGYPDSDDDWMYMIYFTNNRLKSWQREWVGNPYPAPPSTKN